MNGRPGLHKAVVVTARGLVLLVLALLVPGAIDLLSRDRPARDLALRDARATAELDYVQVWRDYSSCYQRQNPLPAWLALEESEARTQGAVRAPADTVYSVVGVRADGPYRRVEVRVEAPGRPPLDYEIDVRQYGGQWVKVGAGAVSHAIGDACA